ncbi:VIR protein [Plasmodium vivax]|uniref:VIR protein n=1 Tax=Plasmodium vivax TaxID=5855 RepID=A0A1G4H9E2_PLAVI|nr:VIR protein [Plasmodium vivax]
MSKHIVDQVIEILKNDDVFWRKSNLYMYYDLFDNGMGSPGTTTLCNNKIKDQNFHNLCYDLEGILNNWHDICEGKESNYDKYCECLIYWLYGKIRTIKADATNIYYLYESLNSILKNKPLKNKNHACNKIYESKVYDMRVLKDKRELYDFVEIYNIIETKLKENDKNKELYCEYVQYIFELFKKVEAKGKYGVYNNEVMHFQNKFLNKDDTLESLDKLCPNMCIKSVFDKSSRTLCPSNRAVVAPVQLNTKRCESTTTEYPDKSQSGMEKYDRILKNLDADKIYKKLNDNKDIKQYCSDCNDVLALEETYPGITVLCKKLARNLRTNMSDIQNDVTNARDRCSYFIHWTYGELKKIFNINSRNIHSIPEVSKVLDVGTKINNELMLKDILDNSASIQKVFDSKAKSSQEFFRKFRENQQKAESSHLLSLIAEKLVYNSEISKHKPCFHYFDCKLDECMEMKNLHDYFKNFESMKDKIAGANNNRKLYCEYVAYIYGLYEKHEKDCCTCYFASDKCVENCPHYFKCEKKYNPYNFYSALKCDEILLGKKITKKVGKPKNINHEAIMKAENVNQHILTEKENAESAEYGDLPSDSFPSFALSVFTFLGILLMVFIFYKFTPLGTWYNRRALKKKRNYAYFYEEYNESLMMNQSEQVIGNPQNRRLRISYQTG